jgi:ADP-heptose:LPS heptosyltransferase
MGLWRLGDELRKSCFDTVIDLQNSKRSHILARLSLAVSRYGYDNRKFSFMLNKKIRDDAPYLDPIEHQFRVLKLAGINPLDGHLELWPSASCEETARKFLEENWVKPGQDLAGINIRASARWVTKNWPASYIAELCDRLARELNIRVLLTGSAEDADYAGHISALARSKPIVAVGRTTIMELACLIKRCKVYLTPDSAPMHIASAVGTAFVALFGPTDPERHLVKDSRCVVMRKSASLKCIPCYSPTCIKNFACMKKITVDEVFGAMKDYLAGGEGAH